MSPFPRRHLRRLLRVVNGGTPTADPENWDGEVPWATPIDLAPVNGKLLAGTTRTLTTRGLATGSSAVPPNSLIMSTRAPIGYVAQVARSTAFNQGCRGLVPKEAVDIRYIRYQLLSAAPTLQNLGQGSTFLELSSDSLSELPLFVPSVNVQRAIADYLDAETARIDALIEKKQRLVELLEERVANRIRQRIADSGLVIPNRKGTSAQIKRVLTKAHRPADGNREVVTAFRDGEVTARSRRRPDGFTQAWTAGAVVQGVRKNDIVIHGLDGFAGAIGVADCDGLCSPVYHVCEPQGNGDAAYLARLLRILAISGYLGLFTSSTRERAFDLRNWDLFGRIPVPAVDPEEQREVGDSIRHIAPLKEAVERSRALALEYRTALITGVVTGEVTVAGIAA